MQSRDERHMNQSLLLARQGQGWVEPNPMVGCVIARGDQPIASGWHQRFGGPHAEVEALTAARGKSLEGATLYVTLEPCCHAGKTPPCTDAILQSGIRRVVTAMSDPFPSVSGKGHARLQAAGIEVVTGCLEDAAAELNAPYRIRLREGRPWFMAKWAMTLDGRMAADSGTSRWISNSSSRGLTHAIRGRVDAILVGRGTVEQDDPLLTARPAGPRTALRMVLDSTGSLSPTSQLVATCSTQAPVCVVVDVHQSTVEARRRLTDHGCEVLPIDALRSPAGLQALAAELGRRNMTNVLVEGGGSVLGSFFAANLIDEVHVFVAPSILGGMRAKHPVMGEGADAPSNGRPLRIMEARSVDGDWYLAGRIAR